MKIKSSYAIEVLEKRLKAELEYLEVYKKDVHWPNRPKWKIANMNSCERRISDLISAIKYLKNTN